MNRTTTDTSADVPAVPTRPDDVVTDQVAVALDATDDEALDVTDDDLMATLDDEDAAAPSGLVAGASAVVAAGLGLASLTGTWIGRVVAERETLIGQITTSQSGTASQQISAIYGDAWHSTALVNGVFGLLAVIAGLVVVARPQRPTWVRAVAVAGTVLGALGLLLSAVMYFDLLVPMPTAAG